MLNFREAFRVGASVYMLLRSRIKPGFDSGKEKPARKVRRYGDFGFPINLRSGCCKRYTRSGTLKTPQAGSHPQTRQKNGARVRLSKLKVSFYGIRWLPRVGPIGTAFETAVVAMENGMGR
jgi:hypothetical protein